MRELMNGSRRVSEMSRQLDLFADIDEFRKQQALDTKYVLEKYGYDIDKTYYIMRFNHAVLSYEIVTWSNRQESVPIARSKHISDTARYLWDIVKNRQYNETTELDTSEFIDYDICEMLD